MIAPLNPDSNSITFNSTIDLQAIIAFAALVLSIYDLWLHFRKERVRLRIRQVADSPAYNFGFVWYERYQCAFFRVRIENLSLTPITIAAFELLCPDGTRLHASQYDIGDPYNPDGLTLIERNDSHLGQKFNLKSENALNRMRYDGHDSADCYLVFFDVPAIVGKNLKYTLVTHVPHKTYRTKLIATPLPDHLRPQHE